jgi:hypothetical protein
MLTAWKVTFRPSASGGSSVGQAGASCAAVAMPVACRATGTIGSTGSTGQPGRRVSTSLIGRAGPVSIGRVAGANPSHLACAGPVSVGRTTGVHAAPVTPCRCRP